MLKEAINVNKVRNSVTSAKSSPKMSKGERICFSWTWKPKRKKLVEVQKRAYKNCFFVGAYQSK
jgi:hypothetical protein